VVPEVEAPEGSGCDGWALGSGVCLGLVPEVDGVGDECGLLGAVDVLGAELGGETGGSPGAGGAAGGAVLAGVNEVLVGIQRLQSGNCCPIVLKF